MKRLSILFTLLAGFGLAAVTSPEPHAVRSETVVVQRQHGNLVIDYEVNAEALARVNAEIAERRPNECWELGGCKPIGYHFIADDLKPLPKAPEQKTEPVKASKYGRGLKRLPKHVREALHELNNLKHGRLKSAIPDVTLAAYDARPTGCIPPVGDQGGCGDCYLWSGCKAVAACMMTNKLAPQDGKFMIAVQYGLDCRDLGGCDGGLEDEVAKDIIKTGWPSLADYGGAGQNPGRCKATTGMTLYMPDSLVYCGTQDGVAPTQAIKNHIYQNGYVSVAAAAGSDWDNVGPGTTITGRSGNVNHAIGAVAWDDNHDNGDGSKGAWLLQNNWSENWADNGYEWIKYGADSFGTGAFSCWKASQSIKPFPPTPVPPGPGPIPPPGPVPPPIPGGTLVITSPATATAVVGQPFTYHIIAAGATGYIALGLPQGFVCAPGGQITGTATTVGTATTRLVAIGPTGFGEANLTITSTLTPVNPVQIWLTQDQVTLVLQQANGRELLNALEMRLTPGVLPVAYPQRPAMVPVIPTAPVVPAVDPMIDERLKRIEAAVDKLTKFVGSPKE